jgi:hypothetical protein
MKILITIYKLGKRNVVLRAYETKTITVAIMFRREKVKLSLCLIKQHAMKAISKRRDILPPTPNIGTRRK